MITTVGTRYWLSNYWKTNKINYLEILSSEKIELNWRGWDREMKLTLVMGAMALTLC